MTFSRSASVTDVTAVTAVTTVTVGRACRAGGASRAATIVKAVTTLPAVNSAQFIVHSSQCTAHSAQWTVKSAQCTVHTPVNNKLYNYWVSATNTGKLILAFHDIPSNICNIIVNNINLELTDLHLQT